MFKVFTAVYQILTYEYKPYPRIYMRDDSVNRIIRKLITIKWSQKIICKTNGSQQVELKIK